MQYPNIHLAHFIDRPNRFIAHCRLLETGEVVTVHVKNTGRTTILQPNVTTALVYSDKPTRKTKYDLVAAKKYDQFWINIDSQAPNQVVKAGLNNNDICLPGIERITQVNPEVTFLDSRLDFSGIGDNQKKVFLGSERCYIGKPRYCSVSGRANQSGIKTRENFAKSP